MRFFTKTLLACLSLALLMSINVFAARADNRDGLTSSERNAKANCGGYYNMIGALWLSGKDPNNGGRLGSADNIVADVDPNAKEVVINYMGSAYSCSSSNSGTRVYASNIRKGKNSPSINDSRRKSSPDGKIPGDLFIMDGTPLPDYGAVGAGDKIYRGVAGDGRGFTVLPKPEITGTASGSYKSMRLYVGDIGKPGQKNTLTVSIFRCFNSEYANIRNEQNYMWANDYQNGGTCWSESYHITIKRRPGGGTTTTKPTPDPNPNPIPKPKLYQLSSNSRASLDLVNWSRDAGVVKSGDSAKFRHEISSHLGDSTLESVSWRIFQREETVSGFSQTKVVDSGTWMQSSSKFSKILNFLAKKSDEGKTICQRVEFSPASKNLNVYTSGDQFIVGVGASSFEACVFVGSDFQPTPEIPLDSGCVGSCNIEDEPGVPDVKIPGKIKIKGDTSYGKWKLTHFVVRPNQFIPGQNSVTYDGENYPGGFVATSNSDPCSSQNYNRISQVFQIYESDPNKKITGCQVIDQGDINPTSGEKNIDINIYGKLNAFDIPESAEIGTKYCFALSVSPYRIKSTWTKDQQKDSHKKWYHGRPGCVVVVKKPKTQILAGGLFANGEAKSYTSKRDVAGTRTFGSWSEFEIIANSGIYGTSSNAAFSNKSSPSDTSRRNFLSFANNKKVAGNFGQNSISAREFADRMRSFYSSSPVTSTVTDIRPDLISGSGDIIFVPAGRSRIFATEINNRNIVVMSGGEVLISENIRQKTGSRSVNDISQMIIIADDIKISKDVDRIDAWLIARKSLDTCVDTNGAKISANEILNKCSKRLDVTAPVVSGGSGDRLRLTRAAGSEGAGLGIGYPAERFSANPDTLQWILRQSSKNKNRIITTRIRELPARF